MKLILEINIADSMQKLCTTIGLTLDDLTELGESSNKLAPWLEDALLVCAVEFDAILHCCDTAEDDVLVVEPIVLDNPL